MHAKWFGTRRRLISPLSFLLGFALRDLMEEDSKVRREMAAVARRLKRILRRRKDEAAVAPCGEKATERGEKVAAVGEETPRDPSS